MRAAFLLAILGLVLGFWGCADLSQSLSKQKSDDAVATGAAAAPGATGQVDALVERLDVPLADQLPRDVYEAFYDDFYSPCSKPGFDSLRIARQTSGSGDATVSLAPPTGSYFLVVVGEPAGADWGFNSVLHQGGGGSGQSLQISSARRNVLTDAEQWCTVTAGISLPDDLQITSSGLAWTVYIVSPEGDLPLPDKVGAALTGYYGSCPDLPEIADLAATKIGDGDAPGTVDFAGALPYYFLAAKVNPTGGYWRFESTDVHGTWKADGPAATAENDSNVGFTAICPQAEGLHHLNVDSEGGDWEVFLIEVDESKLTKYGIEPPSQEDSATPAPSVPIADLLPSSVFDAFEASYDSADCIKPTFESLSVAQVWEGADNKVIEFPTTDVPHFLVAVVRPNDDPWSFDASLEGFSGGIEDLMRLDPTSTGLSATTFRCNDSDGAKISSLLHVDSVGAEWDVFLVAEFGDSDMPDEVSEAIIGHYEDCTSGPPIEDLRVQQTWPSVIWSNSSPFDIAGRPPMYVLALEFQPALAEWRFDSLVRTVDGESSGPRAASAEGETIDFSYHCPLLDAPAQLDIDSAGGDWTMYLIAPER